MGTSAPSAQQVFSMRRKGFARPFTALPCGVSCFRSLWKFAIMAPPVCGAALYNRNEPRSKE